MAMTSVMPTTSMPKGVAHSFPSRSSCFSKQQIICSAAGGMHAFVCTLCRAEEVLALMLADVGAPCGSGMQQVCHSCGAPHDAGPGASTEVQTGVLQPGAYMP